MEEKREKIAIILTRKQLAERLLVSETTISNYEQQGLPVEFRLSGRWPRYDFKKCMKWIHKNGREKTK